MADIDLKSIIEELHKRSFNYHIGDLQKIRKKIKGLQRLPNRNIFSSRSTFDDYAFHYGGRTELQFNIGEDDGEFRHGVAFSLETSRTLPDIKVLIPKIKLFNDYLGRYQNNFSNMRMWHYNQYDSRSTDYMPSSIPHEIVDRNYFIFLGKHYPFDQIDYDLILSDFDRLLPLYIYIESDGHMQAISTATIEPFIFKPGHSIKKSSTSVTLFQKELDIDLRHNDLQEALYQKLVMEYGERNVREECPTGTGSRIDIVVRSENDFWFYEIKTALSPRACIREALGQLLEYAFWPGTQVANCLVIAGEPALDDEGAKYLNTLREHFSLPIKYEQIIL